MEGPTRNADEGKIHVRLASKLEEWGESQNKEGCIDDGGRYTPASCTYRLVPRFLRWKDRPIYLQGADSMGIDGSTSGQLDGGKTPTHQACER
jgi:hypothetical protein